MHSFKIKLSTKPYESFVEMDGQRLSGVTAITVHGGVKPPPEVTITLSSACVEMDLDTKSLLDVLKHDHDVVLK